MSKVRFKMNSAGVRSILQSEEVHTMIDEKVSDIHSRCGKGYEKEVKVGKKRVHGKVYTETFRAMADNSKNNTLLKAVR